MRELTIIKDAALAVADGRITWMGPRHDWQGRARREVPLGGRAVLPSLVDPHTHAIWAGDRLDDFEARCQGVAYEEILRRGGGIRHTVRETGTAPPETLVDLASPRMAQLVAGGAATIEVKSGYGSTLEGELTSLEAIALLARATPATIIPTLLIHVPPRDPSEREAYLEVVTTRLIPEAARRRLATTVDVFIEQESFTVEEARAIFSAARHHGLAIKAHTDQFHAIGGTELAIELGAVSVDHLEASGEAQVRALGASRTVATILPGVSLHLGLPAAPARALIDAGAAVAVGTDLNPGSSPLFSPQLAMALAVRLNRLTPAEAITASTANAAAALGLTDRGRLKPGYRADFIVLDSGDWRDLPWTLGGSPIARHFIAGLEVTP